VVLDKYDLLWLVDMAEYGLEQMHKHPRTLNTCQIPACIRFKHIKLTLTESIKSQPATYTDRRADLPNQGMESDILGGS
jgi:hypothetical protein